MDAYRFDTMTQLTSGVVACGEQDTTSGLSQTDNMAGSGSRKDTVLTDQKLLDAVSSTNLGDELDNFRVPVAAVTTNDQE